jgi:hypothetical protein
VKFVRSLHLKRRSRVAHVRNSHRGFTVPPPGFFQRGQPRCRVLVIRK